MWVRGMVQGVVRKAKRRLRPHVYLACKKREAPLRDGGSDAAGVLIEPPSVGPGWIGQCRGGTMRSIVGGRKGVSSFGRWWWSLPRSAVAYRESVKQGTGMMLVG